MKRPEIDMKREDKNWAAMGFFFASFFFSLSPKRKKKYEQKK
jgi:hypothetical protein